MPNCACSLTDVRVADMSGQNSPCDTASAHITPLHKLTRTTSEPDHDIPSEHFESWFAFFCVFHIWAPGTAQATTFAIRVSRQDSKFFSRYSESSSLLPRTKKIKKISIAPTKFVSSTPDLKLRLLRLRVVRRNDAVNATLHR